MSTAYADALVERRAKVYNEQRAVIDRCATEKRDFDAEERASVDRMDEEIDRLDADIDREVKRWEREATHERARQGWESTSETRDGGRQVEQAFGEGEQSYEEQRMLAFFTGDPDPRTGREIRSIDVDLRPAAREWAMAHPLGGVGEFRDYLTSATDQGAATIPVNYSRQLYAYLETYGGVRRAGPTVIRTSDGNNLTFPRVKAAGHQAASAAKTEGTAPSESEADLDNFTLASYGYAHLAQVSPELVRDSTIDILGFIAEESGRGLGKATAEQYILGDGTTEPGGITVQCSTGKTGGTGQSGVMSFDEAFDLVYSLGDEAYRDNARWLMKDTSKGALRKVLDQNDRPLWEPSLVAGEPDRLMGYPVVTDTYMPAFATSAKSVAYGDFRAGFMIRDVGVVRFERSDHFAFDADLITFKAVVYTDSHVRDTGAIKLYVGGAS